MEMYGRLQVAQWLFAPLSGHLLYGAKMKKKVQQVSGTCILGTTGVTSFKFGW